MKWVRLVVLSLKFEHLIRDVFRSLQNIYYGAFLLEIFGSQETLFIFVNLFMITDAWHSVKSDKLFKSGLSKFSDFFKEIFRGCLLLSPLLYTLQMSL